MDIFVPGDFDNRLRENLDELYSRVEALPDIGDDTAFEIKEILKGIIECMIATNS